MSGGSSRIRMSTHCEVPNWSNILLKHQRQEQVQGDEQGNTSSHHHVQNHTSVPNNHILPIPISKNYHHNHPAEELTWENGEVGKHGLVASAPSKPVWARSGGTLESVVHQGTSCNSQLNPSLTSINNSTLWTPANIVGSSAGKWTEKPIGPPVIIPETRKRARSNSEDGATKNFSRGNNDHKMKDEQGGPSGCASASATFRRDSDTTMLTWASFESPPHCLNLNNNKPTDEDSVSLGCLENQNEDGDNKGESGRSNSTRRSRAAAVHNLSERRRRDRINQKMKALQKLVPNASKTDKASMLDEVIEYLKQLQGQVHMMSNFRNNMANQAQAHAQAQAQAQALAPPSAHMNMMMIPLGMQQHMSMLATAAAMARAATHSFVHPNPLSVGPTFLPMMPHSQTKQAPSSSSSYTPASVPLHDPYSAFLAQSMNMELYHKMAAFYSQQVSQSTTQGMSNPPRSSQVHPDS